MNIGKSDIDRLSARSIVDIYRNFRYLLFIENSDTPMTMPLRTATQVGALLLARRQALKLSQQEVASRLAISQNRLSELERNPNRLTLERLLAYANLVGMEVVLQPKATAKPSTEW
jgi:HTH-type transcriptional regulator / antitoxin HipB